VCLVLGAVTNGALAWWIAARAEPFPIRTEGGHYGFSHPKQLGWFVSREEAFGSVRLRARPSSAWQSVGRERHEKLVPRWSRFNIPPPADHPRSAEIIEHGRGWPMISLSCAFIEATPSQQRGWGAAPAYTIIDAIELDIDMNRQRQMMLSSLMEPPVLPTRIHWPGTIINTLLYAIGALIPLLVILFTWKGARGARRWRRRVKGRCLACGYDLRGDLAAGCPECGWARASAV